MRPPRRLPRGVRIVLGILVSVVLYVLGIFVSAMAVTANAWAFTDGELNDIGIVAVLLLFLAWITVFVRRRWPWVPFIIGALLTAGWGDALLLLIALFHLVIRAPKRQAVIASTVGVALVVFSTVRMRLAAPEHNPFGLFFLPDPTQVTDAEAMVPADESLLAMTIVTVTAALIGLGVSLGVGVLLRRTKRMRAVESIAERETLRSESLSAELARQSEREMLARELHDTLSHRLSVISLHSGALEVGAGTDPEVASTASALRQEARASVEDLRHLVGGVRDGRLHDPNPQQESTAPPNQASMRSIPALIASVQSTGLVVRPSVMLQDVDACPAGLDRAIYRIVQEALTNAMKHAPTTPVTVELTFSAADGARISVRNPVSAPPRPTQSPWAPPAEIQAQWGPPVDGPSPESPAHLASTGSGAGLIGIRERVDLFGGETSIGVRDGDFCVDVTFPPLSTAADDSTSGPPLQQ
nr:histidine kinase [Brevibacterium sp. CT2-23B]